MPVGLVKGIPQIDVQKRIYLIIGDWSTHKRLQRLGADGSSIPQAPGTLNEIGEGACEEVCHTQFQELRYEGCDASPPSVTAHQGAQSTVCFEESEKETSCIVLGIDLQEFVLRAIVIDLSFAGYLLR